MTHTAYATLSTIRFKELRTRLGLAAFIAVTAWFVTPTIWPGVWLAAVLVTQILDWAVFRRFRMEPEHQPSKPEVVLACMTTALSVIVYAGMTAYMWFFGGEIGRIFAMVQAAGGLLHVSLHMHHVRPLLISAVVPHASYFLGLPLATSIITQQWEGLLVSIGCVLYMSHLVVAVRQGSNTTRAVMAARDEALEARQKAEVANAAKSDFLAVVSHEIRTPMNAVISAANLLRRTPLSTQQEAHVDMLTDAGEVLMGLLNDVLDVSKIEAGKMQLDYADMVVRDRLDMLGRLWEPRATANGLRLLIEVSNDAPHAIRTDPLRFQQILFNLISNAVKFTAEGAITVRVAYVQDQLKVAVIDTGCGIPEDRQSQIFNSFEQVDAGTTRRYGGSGLGLAISRRLAGMMGGTLTLHSVEGQGSTFTFSLPVERIDVVAAPVEAAAPQVVSLAGRSILAADDHEVNRRILGLLLEPHGCRLTLVENGAQAVETASRERFDAILMDMQMPVMDGVEASRRIRLQGPNRDTPVVALTANAMDGHRAAWDAVGVHAFLTKPINPALLAEALSQACASSDGRADDTAGDQPVDLLQA